MAGRSFWSCGRLVFLAWPVAALEPGGTCKSAVLSGTKESPTYEQFEHLLQGLVSPLDHLKRAYSELADDFFRKLRQQIEVTQNELREGEQLEVYYTAQGHEPILVSRIGYLEPQLLVLYGQDDHNNDCKVLAHLLTTHLTLKLVRHGDPAKRRTISFVEPTKGT